MSAPSSRISAHAVPVADAGEAPGGNGHDRLLRTIARVAEYLLTAEQWEPRIEHGLAELGRAVGVSRAYIFENHVDDEGTLLCSQRYEWAADGVAPQAGSGELQDVPLLAAGYSRWVEVLGRGDLIHGHIRDFPTSERVMLEVQEIHSLLIVPIFAGSEWWGFMGFDQCGREREWSPAETEALRTAAGILGGAIRNGRTEAALQQSEKRYRRLVEQSPDAIVVQRNTEIVFANEAALRLIHHGDAAALLGRSIFSFIRADDHHLVRERLARPAPHAAHEPVQIHLQRSDGSGVPVEATALGTRFDGAEAVQLVLRDITLRRRAEDSARQLIREQAARAAAEAAERRARFLAEAGTILASSLDYRTTLRSVARLAIPTLADSCVIYVVEDDGKIQFVEAAYADPELEAVLQELLVRDPPDPDSPRSTLARVLRSGEAEILAEITEEGFLDPTHAPEHLDLCRRIMPCSLMCVPLLVRGVIRGAISFGSGQHGRCFDAEDLVLAKELANLSALAVDNARLYLGSQQANQAKSEFMAVMSHELKTPLAAITTFAELLQQGLSGPLTEPQRRQLDIIAANSFHLAQLIDEVLSYVRTESGRVEIRQERADVGALAGELIEWVRPAADGKGLGLDFHPAASPAVVRTDVTRLKQILMNLLTNAVRFTEQGAIRLVVEVDADRVWVRVSDTGIGISEQDQGMIWEPFWQADRSLTRRAGGTGLGLSIVQRLTRSIGGGITLRSALGEGSTFSVWLPLDGS